MWANTYIWTFLVAVIGTTLGFAKLDGYTIPWAISSAAMYWTSYLVGVYTSLIIYRLWLSPLNKFPGPWQAKISNIWLCIQMKNFDGYLLFEKLHKRYGKYVRIGSNDLSISDANLHDVAFSPGTDFRKSEWYDNAVPFTSMHTTRDKALHDRRRRIWAPAFSDRALRDYEPKVKAFNDKLVERVREQQNCVVNVSTWFNLYSFDVMGQLAFGKEYNMLDSGKRHWALDLLVEGMEAVPQRIPSWLFRILINIPFAAQGLFKFLKFCRDEMEWRVKNKGTEGDITGWLLKGYKDLDGLADDPMFQGDSRLIIVAGSDTTAATLTFLFYELAKNPEEMKKLRDELTPLATGNWGDVDIRNAEHLNGAINETLRLHPPVPSGLERKVPKGGVRVGDLFLPGETKFWMPQYVIGRGKPVANVMLSSSQAKIQLDEDYYKNALEFVPERWYSQPEMIKNKDAFAPFSMGSEGCIGKNCKSTAPFGHQNADSVQWHIWSFGP